MVTFSNVGLFSAEASLCHKGAGVTWDYSRHFTTPPLVSPRNDVWEMSAESPYWWSATNQIWVVLQIGWRKYPTRHDQSEALPRSGKWNVISMEYLPWFLRRHFAGEPVVAPWNVGRETSRTPFPISTRTDSLQRTMTKIWHNLSLGGRSCNSGVGNSPSASPPIVCRFAPPTHQHWSVAAGTSSVFLLTRGSLTSVFHGALEYLD